MIKGVKDERKKRCLLFILLSWEGVITAGSIPGKP